MKWGLEGGVRRSKVSIPAFEKNLIGLKCCSREKFHLDCLSDDRHHWESPVHPFGLIFLPPCPPMRSDTAGDPGVISSHDETPRISSRT